MTAHRILPFLTALFLSFALTAASHATLIDNGDGTVTQIRIDGSSLMWDQNPVIFHGTWAQANAWIDSLNSANYKGYDNWRLPTTPGTTQGFDNEGEMGHLYYNEGVDYYNPRLFTNVAFHWYWSGTEYGDNAWVFRFNNGEQGSAGKHGDAYAWPVRDVAAVPEPASLLLLGSGLAGLAGIRRKVRK